MTAAAIILEVARKKGHPIQAVELAAYMSAPHIVASRAVLCPILAKKLERAILNRLEMKGQPVGADCPAGPVEAQ